MELKSKNLWCGECYTDDHLVFLDDLVDTPECGCQHIVCSNCGNDPEELI